MLLIIITLLLLKWKLFQNYFHGLSKASNNLHCICAKGTSSWWFLCYFSRLKLCLLLCPQQWPIMHHLFGNWLRRANELKSQHFQAILGLFSGKLAYLQLKLSTGLPTSQNNYTFLFLNSSTPTSMPFISSISLQQANTLDYSSLIDEGSRIAATL